MSRALSVASASSKVTVIEPSKWSLAKRHAEASVFAFTKWKRMDMERIRENLHITVYDSSVATMIHWLVRRILEYPFTFAEATPVFKDKRKCDAFHREWNTRIQDTVLQEVRHHIAAGFCGYTFRPHKEFGGFMGIMDLYEYDAFERHDGQGHTEILYRRAKNASDTVGRHHVLEYDIAGSTLLRDHPQVWTKVSMPILMSRGRAFSRVQSLIESIRLDKRVDNYFRQYALECNRRMAYPKHYVSQKEVKAKNIPELVARVYAENQTPQCRPEGGGGAGRTDADRLLRFGDNSEFDPASNSDMALDFRNQYSDYSRKMNLMEVDLRNLGWTTEDIRDAKTNPGGLQSLRGDMAIDRSLRSGESLEKTPDASPGPSLERWMENYQTIAGFLFGMPRQNMAESTNGNKLKTKNPAESSASQVAYTTIRYWINVIVIPSQQEAYRRIFGLHLKQKRLKKIKPKRKAKPTPNPDDEDDNDGEELRLRKRRKPNGKVALDAVFDVMTELRDPTPEKGFVGDPLYESDDEFAESDYAITVSIDSSSTINFQMVKQMYADGQMSWKAFKPIAARFAGIAEENLLDEPTDTVLAQQTHRSLEHSKKIEQKYPPKPKAKTVKAASAAAADAAADEEERVDPVSKSGSGSGAGATAGADCTALTRVSDNKCTHGGGQWLVVRWPTDSTSITCPCAVCSHCGWASPKLTDRDARRWQSDLTRRFRSTGNGSVSK